MSRSLYQDKDIIVGEQQVSITCYYFPFGCSKTIRYEDIHSFEMKNYALRGKLWGMNISQQCVWQPGDCNRWDYDKYISFDTGSCIVSSCTCENMDKANEIINQQINIHRKQNENSPILKNQKLLHQ